MNVGLGMDMQRKMVSVRMSAEEHAEFEAQAQLVKFLRPFLVDLTIMR